MVAVKGIFNGINIQLLEKVDVKANTRVVVTFLDDDDTEDVIRDMTATPNGFEFWNQAGEDIYQDFLGKTENEDR